jgi:putative methionine-R-sulfoxide reductase with GAF domain
MPPDSFWIALLERLPSWFFVVASLLVLGGIGFSVAWLATGARRFWEAMTLQQRTVSLTEKLSKEQEQNRILNSKAEQLTRSLENVANLLRTVAGLDSLSGRPLITAAADLVQRAVDFTAVDVKHRPGERHRCGLWIEQDGELILRWASVGFPAGHVDSRKLKVDKSLAGVAFRRQKTVRWDNVFSEPDWADNPNSTNAHKALVCVPVFLDLDSNPMGILTIDGLHPMTDEAILIGEAYGRVVELAFSGYGRGLELDEIDEPAEEVSGSGEVGIEDGTSSGPAKKDSDSGE